MGNGFRAHIQTLADAAGIAIHDLDDQRAIIRFGIGESTQTLLVIDMGEVWEFSCQSAIREASAQDLPAPLLAFLLERNAHNQRGFWCIEQVNNQAVVSYMHNLPPSLITTAEFVATCETVVRQVEALEAGFRLAAQQLLDTDADNADLGRDGAERDA
ncbi:MAG: hypothetical protein RMM58_14025 [Chloroflexota bacterium]|nr:hypothetical protein [Dehalococcoidia bacterium]MDW8254990.1 hypothetical protein [Chloroflexota bacterium]